MDYGIGVIFILISLGVVTVIEKYKKDTETQFILTNTDDDLEQEMVILKNECNLNVDN